MEMLKAEFFALISTYRSVKDRYYRTLDSLESVDFFQESEWAKALNGAVRAECAAYEARLELIRSLVGPEVLVEWKKEYKHSKPLAVALV